VSPVRYELGFYIPEDDILHIDKLQLATDVRCEEIPISSQRTSVASHS
jgi:hypothetical protein